MEKIKGPFYLFAGFALAGTSVIAARFVTQSLGTFTITTVSLFFTLLGLLPLCHSRLRQAISQLAATDWLALLLQSACGIFLFRMFLLQGLLRTSTGEAGILTGATPAATTLLAVFVLKEPLHLQRFFGVVSTVVGIICLQGILMPGQTFSQDHNLGNLLVLCAAVCEALFNVISRLSSMKARVDMSQRLDPALQTWFVAAIAFLLCLAPTLFEQPLAGLQALTAAQWLALLWYGLFVTALAFILFYAGVRRCGATTVAVFSGMMPFTALILSIVLLGESANWQQWLGGTLIVFGMILTLAGPTTTKTQRTEEEAKSFSNA